MRHSTRVAAALLVALSSWFGSAARAEVGGYVAEIEKWRDDFDADVRTGGWLELVGREKLDEGSWTLGSDAQSAVRLPAKAAGELGILTRRDELFLFQAAPDVSVLLDGEAITGSVELSTKPKAGRLTSGDLTLSVRQIGDDFYLLARDSRNPALQYFKGTSWYPISTRYRVPAKFVPYAQPRTEHVPLTHVTSRQTLQSRGELVFELAGQSFRLQTFEDDDGLLVMFQDPTNGKGSYGGGRFVYAPQPTNGVTALDFNKAFNPYCSLNAYIMCPIPPPQNRLSVKIQAGERYFGK
jgi:uncharacterized protein (DUF1684 family)